MTQLLLALHILLFAFSFAFTAGASILGNRIARGGDAKVIHAYFSAVRPLPPRRGPSCSHCCMPPRTGSRPS